MNSRNLINKHFNLVNFVMNPCRLNYSFFIINY